jgi:hypothetical protein
MLEDGWILGRNMSSTTGTIWIHKMSEKKMIQKTELLDYINEGWIKGLPKSPTLGKTWIYHSSNDEYSLCNIDELDSKLAAGWVRKKWSPVKKGFKQEIATCPHCNRTGGKNAMKHLHFDNCNKNPNNTEIPRNKGSLHAHIVVRPVVYLTWLGIILINVSRTLQKMVNKTNREKYNLNAGAVSAIVLGRRNIHKG